MYEDYDENYLEILNDSHSTFDESDEMEQRYEEELKDFVKTYKCDDCMELASKVVGYMQHYYTLDGIAKKLYIQDENVQVDNGYDLIMNFYYYSDDPNANYWKDFISNNYDEINNAMKEASK